MILARWPLNGLDDDRLEFLTSKRFAVQRFLDLKLCRYTPRGNRCWTFHERLPRGNKRIEVHAS